MADTEPSDRDFTAVQAAYLSKAVAATRAQLEQARQFVEEAGLPTGNDTVLRVLQVIASNYAAEVARSRK